VKNFSPTQVKHIATLANIPLKEGEEQGIAQDFDQTLSVITNLNELDVSKTEPTHQVTGLENILREDIVISEESFTQKEALANASHTNNGYFVVPRIIDKDE
jgi:aspartyl-tRNA(Asn)/glutamyl-tRNA(Gln) amidotransferase subunit C